MLANFGEFLKKSVATKIHEIAGLSYTEKNLIKVTPPAASSISVNTLSAIVDYLKGNPDLIAEGKVIVSVYNYNRVDVISTLDGTHRNRESFLVANCDRCEFPFDRFMPVEEFIIGLQSNFQGTGDAEKLVKFVSSITVEAGATISDNGFAQEMTTKQGIKSSCEKIPNPVLLQPYRTFLEAEQPISKFVYRVSKGDGETMPQCKLVEADGGAWKNESIRNVATYLKKELPEGILVVA